MDLHYDIQGEGPPLVLIHSPGADSREWKYIVPILAKHCQIITFDARGTGQSPAPQTTMNPVEDLRLFLEFLKINRITLLGHSMGGQIATDFTLTYPSMVERLILLSPSLSGFMYSDAFTGWMTQMNSLAPDIDKMVEFSVNGPNYKVVMASSEQNFHVEMLTHYLKRVFTEWKSFEVIWPEPPAMQRLENITAPTLFVCGTVEWDDMSAVADQFKRLRNIKFAEIEGADHMLALTHPEQLAACILQFMLETAHCS